MERAQQIDCFKSNFKILQYLAVWPEFGRNKKYYKYYSYFTYIFITIFVFLYNVLFTISFLCAPYNIGIFISEGIFYFTEIAVISKVLTMIVKRNKVLLICNMLESDRFQPKTDSGKHILAQGKRFNNIYYNIIAITSFFSFSASALQYLLPHIFFSTELKMLVSNYYFLNEETKIKYAYYICAYQDFGIFTHMLYNVNIDTLITGLTTYANVQLDILKDKISKLKASNADEKSKNNSLEVYELKECIIHYMEIEKYNRITFNKI